MTAGVGESGRRLPSSAARDAVLLDTGFLVSLIDVREPLHAAARRWLSLQQRALWSAPAVLTETALFLPRRLRPQLARAAASGLLRVAQPDAEGYGRMAALLETYADRQPDWADIELIWLAEAAGIRRIATLDTADFGVYRIRGRRAFDIVWPPVAA